MSLQNHPFRGPFFMLIATGAYIVNDTLMKLATESLPPYQVLMLRGVAGLIWGLPLLYALGYGGRLRQMFDGRVLARNLSETLSVLCYVVALANMPIADVIALIQITPLLVLLGASLMLRERIARVTVVLIAVGFLGALMVAQPTGAGVSVYAALAIGTAVLGAGRDLLGRQVSPAIPGMIVSISTILVVLAGAGLAHLAFEDWVPLDFYATLLLLGAGLFLIFGHFFLFMAYRIGPTSAVAPFYYSFTIWAVLSGLLVFGHMPNALAVAGIALVIASGLAIAFLDERRKRLMPAG
ncbi:MAG: DMT family transporter [Rhizobiaceae bacterium]